MCGASIVVPSFHSQMFFKNFHVPFDEIATGSLPAIPAAKIIRRVNRPTLAAGVFLLDFRNPFDWFQVFGLFEIFPEIEPMREGCLEIREILARENITFAAKDESFLFRTG